MVRQSRQPQPSQYNQTPMTSKSKQIIKRGIAGFVMNGDRCQSIKVFDPDHFFSEFDDEDQGFKNLVEIFREINRRGLHSVFSRMPRDNKGVLVEPYRSACLAAIPRSMSK